MKANMFYRWISMMVLIVLLIGSLTPARAAQAAAPAAPAASPNAFDCAAVTEIPSAECQGLKALFLSTNGTGWTTQTNWLITNTPCSWYGVVCTSGHVTTLNLYNNGLTGSLPPEIGYLSGLVSLMVPGNHLSGPLPPQMGLLSHLQIMYLASNQFSGPIPVEFGNLASLQYPIAWENRLSGAIPAEMGRLTQLQNLVLRSNQLSGSIPPEIGLLPKMNYFDFTTNLLCGQIPAGFGSSSTLTDLRLSGNHLLIPGEPLLSQINAKTTKDSAWTANQTPGECAGQTNSLLAIYVLAYDNDPQSTGNLSAYFYETMSAIIAATSGRTGVRALVLADRSGPGNVGVFEISSGIVSQVSQNLPTLTESTVVDGPELGAFLLWARSTYPADRTLLSYISHNKPLPQEGLTAAPTADLPVAAESGLFPLPLKDGAHSDYTDQTPRPEVLSVYDLAEALRLASQDGAQPLDLVDVVSCFATSFEETYALRSYTRTITGSPNYEFFEPALAGRALLAVNGSMTPQDIAKSVVQAYDSGLPVTGHPRLLVALDTSGMNALKEAWDAVSYNLWLGLNDPATRQSTREKMIRAYYYSHKYDCTFCQPQDWALEAPDALVDLSTFAGQIYAQYGMVTATGAAAANTITRLNAIVLLRTLHNGVPWFGKADKTWDFTGNGGLSLYADLVGRSDGQGHILLNDIAPWYTREVTTYNPHPYEFVQSGAYGKEIQASGITWADTFINFWKDSTNLLTQLCLPSFPPIPESGDVIGKAVISPIVNQTRVGVPTAISATVWSEKTVHNLQVAYYVIQDKVTLFTDTVTVPVVLAGTQIAVQASKLWTPTKAGAFTIYFKADSNNQIPETNESNNYTYINDTVHDSTTCSRPEISAAIANHQQWWQSGPVKLLVSQTAPASPGPSAQVSQLVIDYYQFAQGSNPNTQVPYKVEQRTINPVTLPQTGLAVPLPTSLKPGVVILHIWPRSECGGLGQAQVVRFNYVPTNITLPAHQHQYFAFETSAGQRVNLKLNISQGKAGLYVWMPGNSWSAQMISTSATLTIDPTLAGTYLVNVYSADAGAVYTLEGTTNIDTPLSVDAASDSSTPVVTVARTRPDFTDPAQTNPFEMKFFLPILQH